MHKNKKLIIIGTSAFAEIAYEYFQYDSEYEVIAFSVHREYIKEKQFLTLPVIPFEEVEKYYNPKEYYFFAALVYMKLNSNRTSLYIEAKKKGYHPASYVSSRAFVWRNVTLGEHCFIFEDNTIQPFVSIGNNVILWSGNHIGHHTTIKDNCFISSHVVISGYCDIGENCFLAVNTTLADRVILGKNCFLNSGAVVMKSIPENSIVNPAKSEIAAISATRLFKVEA